MQGLWSLIGKIGTGAAQNFPYEIGDKVGNLETKSVWTLHEGKRKGTDESVSVFVHDVKSSSEEKVQTAKAALRRLKTLRHPNILRFVDGLESETVVYMVTEPVVPLEVNLETEESSKSDLAISWGIHQITAGLSFLINDCSLIHGNVCQASVFVDIAGEWKLGGVEYLKPVDPPPNSEEPDVPRLPVLQVYEPPEGRKYSKTNRKIEKWSADMWGLGCLIWEVFNGSLSRTASLKSVGKIPKNLLSDYVQLVGANPKSRPNPAKFLQESRSEGHYLRNSFVDANLFLQELQIKEQKEQKAFFSSLSTSLDSFPEQFCKHKILPQLLNAYEFGSAGSAVLGPLFKVGKLLEADEYQQKIVPCVVKLFSSTDRATRIHLLQQLDNFVQHLKPSTVDEQIFSHVAMGFGDTVPAMREQTVKSMLLLAPKLSEKTINNQLLKYFAKLQMDQEPGIRTNTTVCLGKIAVNLSPATRQKVLIPAFLRALRDPFPPARTAGIMGFFASAEFFNVKECASRILPALCALTVDPERRVRDQVFKVIKMFLAKLEKASEDPESVLNERDVEQPATAAGSGSSWTGWAVSSLTSKLYRGGNETTTAAATSVAGPATSPEPEKNVGEQKTKPGTRKASDTVHAQRKTTEQTTGIEKDEESGSDYGGDDWGGDALTGNEWSDTRGPDVGELKSDLLAAKEEIASFQSAEKSRSPRRPAGLAMDDDGEGSGSDYGDWENDDWSVDSFTKLPGNTGSPSKSQMSKAVKQDLGSSKTKQKKGSSRDEDTLVAELLGRTPDLDDSIGPQVAAKKTISTKSTVSRTSQNKKKPGSDKTPADEDTAGDMWDVGDWGSFEESPMTKSTAEKEATTTNVPNDGWAQDEWGEDGWDLDKPDKNELAKKKREERRQKQQAQREKRAAGGRGPLKLGGVKMQ